MKRLMLLALLALPTTAMAKDTEKFQAYQDRLAARRVAALETRREYSASKGPHVYRTAVALNVRPFIAVEQGIISQPPIPVRPLIAAPAYVAPYQGSPTVIYGSDGRTRVIAAADRW